MPTMPQAHTAAAPAPGAPGAHAALKPGTRVQRGLQLDRAAVDEQARTATMAVASETPYDRWWGREVLKCGPGNVRLQRMLAGANLLMDHDTRDVVGVVESVQIGTDQIVRAVVRFGRSARAEEVWRHGIFRERHAEFATDALRSLLLEWAGYATQVAEFTGAEHTAKNLLLTGVRQRPAGDAGKAAAVREFAAAYGIRTQALARHLGFDLAAHPAPPQ